MSEWVKALGIDYGDARIGLAVSDDLGMLAHPLETVPAHDREAAIRKIAAIVSKREIRDLVIGIPFLADGSEGDAAGKVRRFLRPLLEALPGNLSLHEIDESFTTRLAMEKLHEVGRNEKNSRNMIDQAAAVEILQRWLDQRAGNGTGPDDPFAGTF